jgi:bacteriorhodopsin
MDYAQLVHSPSLSFLAFQFANAAMAGGASVALGALFLAHLKGNEALCYSAGLSLAICTVAYINYSSMLKTRLRTIKACERNSPGKKCEAMKHEDDFVITCLRYSDWLVTMPLLALKLLDLARDGPNPLVSSFLMWKQLEAFTAALAFVMILAGLIALLAIGDFDSCRHDTRSLMTLRWMLYLVGVICLVGLYVILFLTSNETDSPHWVEVYGFSLVWTLYPLVFIAQMYGLCGMTKDIFYAILDVISKPLLSIYVAKAALLLK